MLCLYRLQCAHVCMNAIEIFKILKINKHMYASKNMVYAIAYAADVAHVYT